MIAKSLLKNPVLMIGILMMFIFLYNLNEKHGFIGRRSELLKARSCTALLVKLKRRVAANWTVGCEKNSLAITVDYKFDEKSLAKNSSMKQVLYREVANNLVHVAKNSPSDNLERTDYIRVRLKHSSMIINALTTGKHLVKFQTLTSPRMIAEHLKTTVNVQEVPLKK
jgi:hypothetical protein